MPLGCEDLVGAELASNLSQYPISSDTDDFIRTESNTFYATFRLMLEIDGMFCQWNPNDQGEGLIFAWAPLDERTRPAVESEIADAGYAPQAIEGGVKYVLPEVNDVEAHIVTNQGWFYSSQERGAELLVTRFSG